MRKQQKSILVLARIAAFIVAALIMAAPAWANNVQVENVDLTGQDTTDDYIDIQFDISWDNSWKLASVVPYNWDAAWVFAKWKVQNGGTWSHCTLSTTDGHHTAVAGSVIDASFSKDNNGTGVFIYRSSEGTGSNDWDGVKLRWNYGTDGMADNDFVDVRVFAIEMVYVPEGAFYLGDGVSTYTFYDNDSPNDPAYISTASLNVNASNYMSGGPIAVDGDGGITDNADYPTGYSAFYCMKYETSQDQYAEFLNTLTPAQDANRVTSGIGGSAGSRTAPYPDRPGNYLSWNDCAAYADWAGLRPMTELEFEKACRGTSTTGVYAWGNSFIAGSAYTLSNAGQPNETIATGYASDPTGNASYNTTTGSIGRPLRCGIYATSTSSRAEAGASYYGIMEMSGNLVELIVTLGNSTGRGFTGSHGDGVLDIGGYADVGAWPGTDAVGGGDRGGCYSHVVSTLRVSDRSAAVFAYTSRYPGAGFRVVRTP